MANEVKIYYDTLIEKVNKQYKGDKTVPYLGNPQLPSGRSEFEYDKDRALVIQKCHEDIVFFAENFFYIIAESKLEKIQLRDYQVKGLKLFQNYKKTIFNTSRQIGKSTLMTIYALWLVTFFEYKNVIIVANNARTSKEILSRIKRAYEQLPNWIKPTIGNSWGKELVEFSNGSGLMISATSADAIRGFAVNCLIFDEAAHIEEHMLQEFWTSIKPTISADPNARLLISSTPNGVGNLFHELWDKAIGGEADDWGTLSVKWYEITGRTQAWADAERRELGDDKFEQEYECKFLESGGSNIPEELYNELQSNCISPRVELPQFDGYKIYKEPDLDNHIYVAGVDVAEGVGQNYSTIQILDVTDMTNIEQVGVYANNTTGPSEFARQLNEIMMHWGKPPLAIERNNSGGGVVITSMDKDYHYPCLINFAFKQGRVDYGNLKGVTSSTNTKYHGVMNMFYFLKTHRRVRLRDIETLKELNTFVRHKNERWGKKSDKYNDDRVDALIWALICIHEAVATQFFTINMWDDNKKPFGLEPLYEIFGKQGGRYRFGNEENNYGADSIIFSTGNDFDPFIQEMNNSGWLLPEQDAQRGWRSYEPSPYQFLNK